MKKILQALDGASTKPVEGSTDMQKFVKIINEGSNPHKVTLPVQMAMQHYQQPKKEKLEEVSVFRTYVAVVEDELQTQQSERKQLMRQYGQRIAESVLKKNVSERVTIGPDGQVTGGFKPTAPAPSADPVADKPATPTEKPAPLSSRYDPRLKQTGDPYTIDVGGKQYKFAGRGTAGPGTGEVIKVPGGNVGIRGLAPVSVELGNDGMYYVAPRVDESKDTVKVPVTQKPRQGPLRPQTGAGAHKDKKKDQKQGKEKHKKPFYELADVESLEQTLSEIKKGQKDSNGFTKCWPGKHAEGTKKGKNGKPVRNCVPNESVNEMDKSQKGAPGWNISNDEGGKEHYVKSAKPKDVVKKGVKALNKAMDKAHPDYDKHEKKLISKMSDAEKKDKGWRNPNLKEYGDTAKGQKMLTKVQKRAVDRVTSKKADTDPKYAKKNSDTANRAWERMSDKDL